MGNPFDNYDYESEFNYLMEMFDHPYKEMVGNYASREYKGEIKIYDLGTIEGMRDYYFKECCPGDDVDLHQRVGDFLEILIKAETHTIFHHITNAIVWDLQVEMDEIKGATNN